jgi:hypothetical protein
MLSGLAVVVQYLTVLCNIALDYTVNEIQYTDLWTLCKSRLVSKRKTELEADSINWCAVAKLRLHVRNK